MEHEKKVQPSKDEDTFEPFKRRQDASFHLPRIQGSCNQINTYFRISISIRRMTENRYFPISLFKLKIHPVLADIDSNFDLPID
jgi:hypothetical protein